MERLIERRREPEPQEQPYDLQRKRDDDICRRRAEGTVVIRGKDLEWYQSRQSLARFYLWEANWDKLGAPPWRVFIHDIKSHSGCHKHQGGLAILVLKGKGYTVVDGTRYDWEEGDCVLLPVKPGGVEHQHFNLDPQNPALWLALIYTPLVDQVNIGMTQVSEHPDWSGIKKRATL